MDKTAKIVFGIVVALQVSFVFFAVKVATLGGSSVGMYLINMVTK